MNVTVIADAKLSVPPLGYGGTERIVASLCKGLMERGHSVTLVARAESTAPCTRLIPHRHATLEWSSRAFRKILFQPLSLFAAWESDVVHVFGRIDYTEALIRGKRPLVYTFENPISDREIVWLSSRMRSRVALTSVSDAQRATRAGPQWSTVYNSIDTDLIRPPAQPVEGGYLAFLGRLSHNKGVDAAIRVARSAGVPLRLAGNISDEAGGREYFESKVRPQLGDGVEWVGEISDPQKTEFLGNALGLIFPIRWEEPCALVVAEALACGTPVVAANRGSTREQIWHGVTGFVCDSEEEMIAGVAACRTLSRASCRNEAVKRFSAQAMTEAYLRVYRSVVASWSA